jgi:hypothetical protein
MDEAIVARAYLAPIVCLFPATSSCQYRPGTPGIIHRLMALGVMTNTP